MIRAAALAVLLLVAGTWLSVASLPYFSETWTNLVIARALPDWTAAFSLQLEPRPLHYLFFRALALADGAAPWLARLPAFAMQLASCLLAGALAQRLGAGRRGAAVAALLLAIAPTVKNQVFVAAIGGEARVVCVLAALLLHARWRERRRAIDGGGCVLAMVVGLGFHPSAVIVPVLLLLWTRARGERWRDPLLGACLLVAAFSTIGLTAFGSRAGTHVGSLDSVAPALAKALQWHLPEPLRLLITDACRGAFGTAAGAAGAAVLASLLLLAIWLTLRGGPIARFVAPAVVADMALPALASSPFQRYAYLGTALIAVGLGAWVDVARSRRWPLVLALVLGAAWLHDQVRDIRDYREAGAVVRTVLDQAAELRERFGPERRITLVDLPDAWGTEEDLPVFNWGFPAAAEHRGAAGFWVLWRTRDVITTTDSHLVTEQDAARRMRLPGEVILRFDDTARRLQPVGAWTTADR